MTDHRGILKYLFDYILKYKRIALFALLLMLGVALTRMAPPYILKIAIDQYISRKDFGGLTLMAFLYLFFIVAEYITIYLQIYMTQLFGQSVIRDMRLGIFSFVLNLPVPYFDKTPQGKSLNYMTNDIENINEFITSGIVTTMGDVITIVGILFVMIYLNLPLTGVVFFFFLFLFVISHLFRKRFKKAYQDTRESVSQMNGFIEESLAGIYVSKAFNRKQGEIAKFGEKNRRYIEAFKRVIFYLSLYFPFVESVGIFSILAILWTSGKMLAYGSISFGVIVAFIEYSHKLYNPIRDLSEKYNLYQSAASSLEKIHALRALEIERKEGSEEAVSGDIELRDVWLSYDGDGTYALKGVNLTIREGEKVGIVGLTGSGKTSLINLMLGFYKPTRGEIRIGGKTINAYSSDSIRKAFGIVSQDVYIFPRTIEENFFGSDKDLPQSLQSTMNRFFRDGLTKTVSEDGLNLSEGEKQLISIGRMITYKPRYVILDEATSRIDRYLEEEVRGIIRSEFASATQMVIAHRLSTMTEMDRIIVIHDGRLTEEGTHEELVAKKGIYSELYAIYTRGKSGEGVGVCC